MMTQKFWLPLEDLGVMTLQGCSYIGMELMPLTTQQGRIDRILDQPVFEQQRLVWRHPTAKREAGCHESVERCIESCLRFLVDRGNQLARKLPADRGTDLCHLFSGGIEPVQPRHQQSLQRCRNGAQ